MGLPERPRGCRARRRTLVRLHGLRATIGDMAQVVDAFRAAGPLPEKPRRLMMNMTATVACELMEQAMADMEAVLALSPQLRAVIERVDGNMKRAASDAAAEDGGTA